MTILHVADLHFNQPWYHWLSDGSPPHDLLVIAGDLLDLNHPASHRQQAEWVGRWIQAHRRPVSICSGNHDLAWDSEYNVFRAARWLTELTTDHACVDGELREVDGITLYHNAALGSGPRQAADIWVTHAPPPGPSVGWCDRGRAGSDPRLTYDLRRYEPTLVLCGHVHRPLSWSDQFEGALYLNPGHEPAARFPHHILIDLDQGSIRRVRENRDDDVIDPLPDLPTPLRQRRPSGRRPTRFAALPTLN